MSHNSESEEYARNSSTAEHPAPGGTLQPKEKGMKPLNTSTHSVDPANQAQQTLPFSLSFFDASPPVSAARRVYFQTLLQRVALVVALIFCVFSIYWGALWRSPHRALAGWIVDFDADMLGRNISQRLASFSDRRIIWQIRDAREFPNGPEDVQLAIVEEKCWVAVTSKRISSSLHYRLFNQVSQLWFYN
jgi:hypothetical protein